VTPSYTDRGWILSGRRCVFPACVLCYSLGSPMPEPVMWEALAGCIVVGFYDLHTEAFLMA
jgi:hypothetical protein